ncbi:MAG: glutamyl-tRNA reductase [Armatimonadota bacterium]
MRVVLTGLSHKTAPVELREKLSLYGRSTEQTLHGLRDAAGMAECAVLSTCNRTEFYGISADEDWQEHVLELTARTAGVSPGHLQEHLYSYEGTPAVRHLFRVASGLDSMVLGEGQILSQVKDALQTAQEAGTSGTVIHALFQHAISSGKRARSETEIGRGAVSISLAAVQLAKQIFQSLDGHVVLLIGAGETGEQTARMLLADNARPKLVVCNRTQERAEALAAQYSGATVPYDRLGDALARADIVISSTGSPEPILPLPLAKQVMRARRGRPMFLIDIAVPRDVDPVVGELDDVYLYNIDDLQEVVEKSRAGRQAEAERVEGLIEEEIRKFQSWSRGLEVAPTIRQLQELAEQIIRGEHDRVGGRLSHLSQRDQDMVDALVRGVVNKLLRGPIVRLKQAADSGNGYREVESVRAIFGLHGDDPAAADERRAP